MPTPDGIRTLIPAYLAGELTPLEQDRFTEALSNDPAFAAEVRALSALWADLGVIPTAEPSDALRAGFYARLHSEQQKQAQAAIPRHSPRNWLADWRAWAAAAAVFVLGIAAGVLYHRDSQQSQQLAQMRSQVQSLREMVAISLLERQSAASRLQGVTWSSRVERPDNELLSALVAALNSDPNVNVRLSTIDALEPHLREMSVHKALLESIARQQSPLVQIALIDSLADARDASAMAEFERLSKDQDLSKPVRERARLALARLDRSDK